MVDRMSGLVAGGRSPSKRKGPVREVTVSSMCGRLCRTVTLDRGKEFAEHALFTEAVGAECHFCPPHHPWRRGTNENTNGLLRQHFPKGCDLDAVGDEEVQAVYDELNRRPRERLGWRAPYEVYHSVSLSLLRKTKLQIWRLSTSLKNYALGRWTTSRAAFCPSLPSLDAQCKDDAKPRGKHHHESEVDP